mmetsp:Transcript_20384/g.42857  ORF Transcript_20384/g.42857 Transcript_20384/m.42857 type:complete len:304 (+) Transcript_20384:940-1851(+)
MIRLSHPPTHLFAQIIIPRQGFHLPKETLKGSLLTPGIIDCLIRIIHRLVPSLQQKHDPKLPRRIMLQRLPNRDKILERLGHFQPLDVQMSRVCEVIDPLLASETRFRLSQFIVVVRKFEILPSRVNIEIFPQNIPRDDGAFDVPPRTPRSKRRIPRRFPGLASLPQRKVVGVAFLAPGRRSRQGSLPLGHFCRGGGGSSRPSGAELAIIVSFGLEGVEAEVDGAVALVGQALVDDFLDEGDDLGYVFRDAGEDVGFANSEGGHVFHEFSFVFSGMLVEDGVVGDEVALFSVEFFGQDGFGGF